MPYRCILCGKQFTDLDAAANDFACLRKCGGRLQPDNNSPTAGTYDRILGRLPSVIAIPLDEYAAESHPVLRLHRLCDAAELVTRFATLLALSELRARLGDKPLPSDLLGQLQPQIERPTFGQWCGMLRALVGGLDAGAPLVLPELPTFVTGELMPALDGSLLAVGASLVQSRNELAHGGAMTSAAAREHLNRWEPWLIRMIDQLGFLADVELCHFEAGKPRRLVGPNPQVGAEVAISAELRLALAPLDGHVVLLRGGRWLDLWPLCDYGRALAPSPAGPRETSVASPLVYARAERDRLLYAALGVDWPRGERANVVRQFRDLFKLDERSDDKPVVSADFEADLRADAAALVGRVAELKQAKAAIKAADTGVLWISGPAGIGKSFLLAKLATDFGNDPKRLCRIAWRFRAGDGDRCSRAAFLRHAVERLTDWLAKSDVIPAADPAERFTQLRELLDEESARPAADPRGRPLRVLFVLDGLDEIDRLDSGFAQVPFMLSRPNVLWLCAGRAERELPNVFAPDHCTHVFADGLPPMTDADVRGMLIDGSGSLKYDLLRLDREMPDDSVMNAAVEAVVHRAAGLPLYVHYVVEDILAGHYRFDELDRKLPPSLNEYYDDLLASLGIARCRFVPLPMTAPALQDGQSSRRDASVDRIADGKDPRCSSGLELVSFDSELELLSQLGNSAIARREDSMRRANDCLIVAMLPQQLRMRRHPERIARQGSIRQSFSLWARIMCNVGNKHRQTWRSHLRLPRSALSATAVSRLTSKV